MSRDKYLRVSEVCSLFNNYSHIDPAVLQNAADRGTRVHKTCAGIIKGLGEWGVDDQTENYVKSFKNYWEGLFDDYIAVEDRLYCDKYKLTGQPDLIKQMSVGLAIVDWKTPIKPSPAWEYQASGYYYLAKQNGYQIKTVLFVMLSKYGYEAEVLVYPADDSAFLKLLEARGE